MAALVDDVEGLRWVTRVSEKKKGEVVEIGAVARHVMKCKRGEQCPIIICRELKGEDAMKEQVIQAFNTSSVLMPRRPRWKGELQLSMLRYPC